MAVKPKTNWRAAMNLPGVNPTHYRGESFQEVTAMVEVYWLGQDISQYNKEKLKSGQPVKFTAMGEVTITQVEAKDECEECDVCMFLTRIPDDPQTHCINCMCIFCIPGA